VKGRGDIVAATGERAFLPHWDVPRIASILPLTGRVIHRESSYFCREGLFSMFIECLQVIDRQAENAV